MNDRRKHPTLHLANIHPANVPVTAGDITESVEVVIARELARIRKNFEKTLAEQQSADHPMSLDKIKALMIGQYDKNHPAH